MTTSPFPTASSFNHNSLQGLSTGNPHTQYQQVSEKGQNGGYAGIDTNGFLSVPARTIRNASDPSTPSAGEIWVNGGEFRFNDGAATRAAVPTSRQVLPGGGLTGGGALTADVTLNIAAFTGLVSKDVDPASQTYAASSVTTVLTVDVGADGELTPIAIRLPATTDSNLQTGVIFEFAGSGSVAVFNSSTTNVLDSQFQALMLVLMGDLTVGPANNGKRLQRIRLQIKNTSGSTAVTTDIGVFRLRAIAGPRGAGSAL